jgi:hypothetical protein
MYASGKISGLKLKYSEMIGGITSCFAVLTGIVDL